ncbi:TorF family putative porin [Sphingomonas nostoxanthinifaciens]|uniref:TorF family putative porin n=1 Tax=Sphingomonas nostoxanthinifaciens TaxID=2872652 RepID=UPI0021DAFB4A|nr:TorF family putative porin [Sphingomonas nostoxanthinifaciens]UAK23195.1 TorF family putative porin [Sphingomonas nostoxanthinifaciens]
MALLFTTASPAIADIGGRVAIASEETFRGRSISAGRPAIGLDLAYDDVGGAYVGVQGKSVLAGGATPQFLSAQAYAGYAWRVGPDLTVDAGLTHTRFSRHSSLRREADYSEAYIGLADNRSSARLSLSPDWLGRGNVTAYGEIAHQFPLSDRWSLALHGGLLLWLSDGRPATVPKLRYDTRLGLARRLGRVQLEAGWTVGGPRSDRYGGDDHGHHIVTLGASLPL